ncbi:MAG: DEAD/DEAH box helicase, partial [Thermoplasmata archaeon]|nr:DEAD/DEAH box helicase [Thermoplasmata archaeon]
MTTFKELGLSDKLLGTIERLEFSEPTRIQKEAIPFILSGKDIIGESETGSGKTLAFGCGIIEKCSREGGIQALVLTPTRELAEQVKDSIKELVHKPRLNIAAIYGGTSINTQIKNLTRANVVVATPGRLLDHIDRGTIDLRNVKYLVMDEADRMFDMGFIDDVNKIIKRCPRERQTLFFSATISPDVKKLAKRHMKDPETVLAGNIVDPAKLKQTIVRVSKNQKFSLLTHLLKQEGQPLAMVFCNTRHLSDFVDKNLRFNGIKAAAIHGGLTQNARLKAIDRFHAHEVDVLVCTDVAARGLHIKNVSHVINYDLPPDPNDYVHRIGRTARAGESGQVVNILTNFDKNLMKKIQWQNKAFKIENMEMDDFKEAKITTTMGRIKNDHSARPGSGRWDTKESSYRNSQEKHRSWKSNSGGRGESWQSNSKPGSYRKNSDGNNGKSSKPGGYNGKSDGYKGRS